MIAKPMLFMLLAAVVGAAEPAPHPLPGAPVKLPPEWKHVSGAYELPDGRVLISDANAPAVSVLAADGTVTALGSPGSGDAQYAQPGGFCPMPDGSLLLIDRAGPRAVVWSSKLQFLRAFSLAEPGVQRSSSADYDWIRVDGKGRAYFTRQAFMPGATTTPLVRLDPSTGSSTVIAQLQLPEMHSTSTGDGMTYSRIVVGSPADDWGVAPDGRVALVRANPYRVDWLSAAGTVTKGPEIAFDALPMTDADKQAFEARNAGNQPRVGAARVGDSSGMASLPTRYAATKPPFATNDVIVSPLGQVWVMRSMAFGSKTVACDVFDGTGARTMRVEFPAGSRIVGFGPKAVFVRQGGDGSTETLMRYPLP